MKKSLLLTALLLTLNSTTLTANEELIQNGSFENFTINKDYGKWKLVNFDNWSGDGEVWNHQIGRVATKGTYKAELDVGRNSVNSLTQTVTTVSDTSYTLSLDAYARTEGSSDFKLLIDGQEVLTVTPGRYWTKYGIY